MRTNARIIEQLQREHERLQKYRAFEELQEICTGFDEISRIKARLNLQHQELAKIAGASEGHPLVH